MNAPYLEVSAFIRVNLHVNTPKIDNTHNLWQCISFEMCEKNFTWQYPAKQNGDVWTFDCLLHYSPLLFYIAPEKVICPSTRSKGDHTALKFHTYKKLC